MKVIWLVVAGAFFLAFRAEAQEQAMFTGPMDKLNYGIGVETARSLKSQGVDINLDLLIKGLKDGLAGGPLLVSEKELRRSIISFQSELRRRQAVSRTLATMDNISSGSMRTR